jgi:kynurenine 3-monooxygenase
MIMENGKDNSVHILGAGLVGTLLSVLLARKGFQVNLFEKRTDIRKTETSSGRSINLALSHRGIKALKKAEIFDEVKKEMIPMQGRMIHDEKGGLRFQPYGKKGQAIFSVSRARLNAVLLDQAEQAGVKIFFENKCVDIDFSAKKIIYENQGDGAIRSHNFAVLVGADGAFSALRSVMGKADRFDYCQRYLDYGYKELTIPAMEGKKHQMEPNALHIWPRGRFMLIALPNTDGSFTCTLFLPFEGEVSFSRLTTEPEVVQFFQTYFPDALELIPGLFHHYFCNPASSLVTIECWPWSKGNCLLVGDAAHAIVPFYGQGMNAGFEDCDILIDCLGKDTPNWAEVFEKFANSRKKDTDAIAQLALENFIEMRDSVADPGFLLRKKIDARLHELYPDLWVPQYSMVTFSSTPYSQAMEVGKKQSAVLDHIMGLADIHQNWDSIDLGGFLHLLEK